MSRATDRQLEALSAHLLERRDAIVHAWRQKVREDPEVTAGAALTRKKFDDDVPAIIGALARRLRAWRGSGTLAAVAEDQGKHGAVHGAHRWEQGYDLPELTREWGHLQLCLLDELDRYLVACPDLDSRTLGIARRAFSLLCTEGLTGSVAEYVRLQRVEAARRVNDLEAALAQLGTLQRQRAEDWRQAAHDLRNQVGVVTTVSAVLGRGDGTESTRAKTLDALQRNIAALGALLNDLLSVARLEAGHEERHIAPLDASALMRSLSASGEALAGASGLKFHAEGPPVLEVAGDEIKLQRIAHNLLLNAFKHANGGTVRLRWGEHGTAEPQRWMLEVSNRAATRPPDSGASPAHAAPQSSDFLRAPGEGVGLSIVKRLCELLDATLELEENGGATFRVIFPRRYA